ncbi:hypothetical protein BB559_002765 [Furculomyces boomerangus]|uniref:Nucleolar complex protein 14 n=1 Tax=Furculomyces boomerangus TaxID=61424 RepID=A0A2T9YSP2_9FUNG|nr:hypothetical protein BB559_002765 [Furculomyces boomerangus]
MGAIKQNPKGKKLSALKKLKSSLSTAGIIGQKATVTKKDKKKSTDRSTEMQKKLASKLREIQNEMNPFEIQVNNKKDQVLGRKVRGESGRPAISRQQGIEKREKTLLVELDRSNKVGGIKDRRFGENNPSISYEEKMLTRFTKERQKQINKPNLYDLSDGSDNETLTHFGQNLADVDDYDNLGLDISDDDETSGAIDKRTVSNDHFGGFESVSKGSSGYSMEKGDGTKKTRAEIMQEVIAKSKMYRYERQQAREDDSLAREELDEEFNEIQSILASEGNFSSGKVFADKPQRNSTDELYDTTVRELIFDKRAKPMDRLKTEEEIAAEQKHTLEKAERHRIRRMKGIDSENIESKEDNGISGGKGVVGKKGSFVSSKKVGDDELPYTFDAPEDYNQWVELVDSYTLEQQLLIADRLRVLYHPSLSPQNKSRCENMFEVFMEHIAVLSEQDPPVPQKIIDGFAKHISDLASISPVAAGNFSRDLVVDFQSRMVKDMNQQSGTFRKYAPLASDLVRMRLLISIFSSSDKYHPVITPVILALSQYLSLSLISNGVDASKHVIICGILHEAVRLSRRYIPEVMNSLQLLMYSLLYVGDDKMGNGQFVGMFPLSNGQQKQTSKFRILVNGTESISDESGKSYTDYKMKWGWLTNEDEAIELVLGTKLALARSVLVLVEKYAQLYFAETSFPETFDPFIRMLGAFVDQCRGNKASCDIYKHALQVLDALNAIKSNFVVTKRKALELQKHKPVAIRQVAPKFDAAYSLDKHYDKFGKNNRENSVSEVEKLTKMHKKETRGAIRELRKDAMFLSQAKLTKQKEKDEIYKNKMKAAWSILETDQGEFKKEDRMNKKFKR